MAKNIRAITPPGQEGWREAPGWLFNQIANRMKNDYQDFEQPPVCGFAAAPPLSRRGNRQSGPLLLSHDAERHLQCEDLTLADLDGGATILVRLEEIRIDPGILFEAFEGKHFVIAGRQAFDFESP